MLTEISVISVFFSIPLALGFERSEFPSRKFVGDAIALSPGDNYRVHYSEHFKIIYPRAIEELAKRSTGYLEDAHRQLSPFFLYAPKDRTTVILTDNQDLSNGVASAVGHQGLVLFAIAPEPFMSINDNDNWLKNLCTHEYTHYLTLHPTRGVFKLLTYIFGDTFLPNSLWPAWLAEGYAVYAETRFSRMGRGSGPYYTTIARDSIARKTLGESFLTFNEITGVIPEFPFGEAAYFAGFAMIDQLAHEKGKSALGELSIRSSGRFPYFLNTTLEATFDKGELSYQDLWINWIKRKQEEFKSEIDQKQTGSPIIVKWFTDPGLSHSGGRLSPDENLLATVVRTPHERSHLSILDLKTQKTKIIDIGIATPGLSWAENVDAAGKKTQTLYYTKVDFHSPFQFFGDLYSWSEGGGTRKLTSGERVKDPGFCRFESGDTVVLTRMHQGISELLSFDLQDESLTVLFKGKLGQRFANPRCGVTPATQNKIYFSVRNLEPFEQLAEFDRTTKSMKVLIGGWQAGYGAQFPEPTDLGLYFTKVTKSHFSLAFYTLSTGKIELIAQDLGGYWFPQQTKTKLLATYFSSNGFQTVELDPLATSVGVAPQTTSLAGHKSSKTIKVKSQTAVTPEAQNTPTAPEPEITEWDSRHYYFLESLLPRIWSPTLTVSSARTTIGAAVAGWDDTDQMSYIANGWYDTFKKGPNGIVMTQNRLPSYLGSLRLNLRASSDLNSWGTVGASRYYFQEQILGGTLSRPFPKVYSVIIPSVSLEWSEIALHSIEPSRDDTKNSFGTNLRVGPGLLYDSRQKFTYSIDYEAGQLIRARSLKLIPLSERRPGTWKFLFDWNPVIEAFPAHTAFDAHFYYAFTSRFDPNIYESYLRPGEMGNFSDLDPPTRGYQRGRLLGRKAFVGQFEYRFPIEQVFRSPGTFPFFMRNHGLGVFADFLKYQSVYGPYRPLLVSVGGAYTLNIVTGYIAPLSIRVQFASGFNKNYYGERQLFISLGI